MECNLINIEERARWNDFVTNSPKGHIFQSFEWGEAMANLGWEPFRIVVEDGKHIKACISILMKKILPTPWSIFYSPRGPIINFNDQDTFHCLMEGIKKIGREKKAIFLQVIPHISAEDKESTESLNKEKFYKVDKQGLFRLTQPLWVYRVDLSKTKQELMSQMKHKTRYNIRLSMRKGVEVSEGKTLDDLTIFYKMLRNTADRKNFPVRRFATFKSVWEQLVPSGYAKLFFAIHQGEILSGVLVFLFNKICWYMYGASDVKNRNLMANYALHWHIINWAKENGCLWYDLRGVPTFNPSPKHSGFGIYRFKKGFGGLPLTFAGDYYYIFRPSLYKFWELSERYLNKMGGWFLKIF